MFFITFMKAFQRLQDSPPKGSQRILNTGPQAKHALQMWFPQQLLSVGNKLGGAAEQGSHIVYKLWHKTGVGIISLAIVIGNNLQKGRETQRKVMQRKLGLLATFIHCDKRRDSWPAVYDIRCRDADWQRNRN